MKRYLLIYFATILVFGTIYWGYWSLRPDSFIINEQFNLHPFSSKYVLGDNFNSLAYYQKKADSLRNTIDSVNEELSKTIIETDSLKPISRNIFSQHEKARWDSIERWKKAQIPDSLEKKLAGAKQSIDILKEHEKANELVISQLNVEKARIEYEIAKINLTSSDFILANLTYFQDTSLVRNFLHIDSILSANEYHIIPDLELKIRKIEHEIEQLKFDAIDSYSRRISFLDFLLFSAANSSTVTYGDITPNDTLVRIILFIQALFCIVLIALFIEVLIKKIRI